VVMGDTRGSLAACAELTPTGSRDEQVPWEAAREVGSSQSSVSMGGLWLPGLSF
jgi:hypothetical protein